MPVQHLYVAQVNASGIAVRPGSGAVFHSCYLGAWFFTTYQKNYTRPCFPKPCNGTTRVTSPKNAIWNQIQVGGASIQQSISKWWRGSKDAPPIWLVDSYWNATGVAPTTTTPSQVQGGATDSRAPIVPWYDSHFFTNPTCRGYPWY